MVRALVDATNRGDMDALFKDAAPDIEYNLSRRSASAGVHRGLDEARRAAEEFSDAWESLRYEIEEYIEVEAHVVTPFTNYLRGARWDRGPGSCCLGVDDPRPGRYPCRPLR